MLDQDWDLMQDGALMQAKTGNKELGSYEGKRRTERLGAYAE